MSVYSTTTSKATHLVLGREGKAAVPVPKLTRFDLLDHRLPLTVLHLPDVQQGVGVPIVGGPVVHKDPGAAAATVHHNPIIQRWVLQVCGLHGLSQGEVPAR